MKCRGQRLRRPVRIITYRDVNLKKFKLITKYDKNSINNVLKFLYGKRNSKKKKFKNT